MFVFLRTCTLYRVSLMDAYKWKVHELEHMGGEKLGFKNL